MGINYRNCSVDPISDPFHTSTFLYALVKVGYLPKYEKYKLQLGWLDYRFHRYGSDMPDSSSEVTPFLGCFITMYRKRCAKEKENSTKRYQTRNVLDAMKETVAKRPFQKIDMEQ